MCERQIAWRRVNFPEIKEKGVQNGKRYEHILPWAQRKYNFFPDIYNNLFEYVRNKNIQAHTGIHNLLSSWALCANLYWPFNNKEGFELLKGYLNTQIGNCIKEITSMDLEYLDDNPQLSPHILLGEENGSRGKGQTSPDLAIKFIDNDGGKGILLIESKFTEHNFYCCSANKKNKSNKVSNPDKTRCFNTSNLIYSDFNNCHLTAWNRNYWCLLKGELDFNKFILLKKCPAFSACYQLLRQQALAKGYENYYSTVFSCVAMDKRNDVLINSLRSVGLESFPGGWKELFPNSNFACLDHFQWFKYVKENDITGKWSKWLLYIENRYF